MEGFLPEWLHNPRQFPLVFVVGWVACCVGLAFVSGWHDLARRFRATGQAEGERFSFASGAFRAGWFPFPVGAGRCLTVVVGAAGVRISTFFLFRIMHPPLLIPWSAIESVTPETHMFFWRRTAIRVRGTDSRVALFGDAGTRVESKAAQMKVGAGHLVAAQG